MGGMHFLKKLSLSFQQFLEKEKYKSHNSHKYVGLPIKIKMLGVSEEIYRKCVYFLEALSGPTFHIS